MAKNVGDALLSLGELDSNLAVVLNDKEKLELDRNSAKAEIDECKSKLEVYLNQLEEVKNKHKQDETRLKDEQSKIVERRKALSDLGGAKSAKLVEREIDIANRALQALEEQMIKSLDEVDRLQGVVDSLRSNLEDLQGDFEAKNPEQEKTLSELIEKTNDIEVKREKILGSLEPRLKNLYSKVRRRYPGGAVAVASKQSCRSCFRALPSQLYNQLMAGGTIFQCPGCSRILVYKE